MPFHHDRRRFLQGSAAGGVSLLTFSIGGCDREMSPAEARREGADLGVLSAAEVATLERLGDDIVPGAAERGLAHFVDQQLGAKPADCMLMAKYLGLHAPFTPFYRAGLAALDSAARSAFDRPFADLDTAPRGDLVGRILSPDADGWDGPPAGLFVFAVRCDAVDVRYGTEDGFAELGIPYMAHIAPTDSWGA